MYVKDSHRALRAIGGLFALGAFGLFASPALAISANEPVSGITSSSLALTASTGAAFATSFAPGNTATTIGALTLLDTSPTWTLQVNDANTGTGAGHMQAAATACTNSESQLSQPLDVNISVPGSTVLPTGNGVNTGFGSYSYSGGSYVQIGASPATVAQNNTGGQLLAADVFATNYVQPLPSSDVMTALCRYSLTATYTLQ